MRGGKTIFVALGSGPNPFNRLLETLDEIACEPGFKYRIVAQIGSSTYRPKNYEYFTYTTPKRYEGLIRGSSMVIQHGGAGTTIFCLMHSKPSIIFPRRMDLGEAKNDSGLDLIDAFERRGAVVSARDKDGLKEAIKKAEKLRVRYDKDARIIKYVDDYLADLDTNKKLGMM